MYTTLDRREFLRLAGLGGAALSLPASGFAPLPALNVRRASVAVGTARPFSVLHVSDSHLARIDSRDGDGLHAFARARSRIGRELGEYYLDEAVHYARANKLHLVHTGDFMDFMSRANYEYAVRRFKSAEFIACVGNHEYWLDAAHPEEESYKLATIPDLHGVWDGVPASVRKVCGVNFFVFDDAFGRVSREIAERFVQTVDEGLPIVLVCHVPLCTDAGWSHARWSCGVGRQSDATTREFVERVQGERLVRAVLCGHIHAFKKVDFSANAVEFVAGPLFAGDCTQIDFI